MDQSEAIREVVDQPALDRDGEAVGRVVEVFVDEDSDTPKWVALQIEGRDGSVLAPIGAADLESRPFRLDVDRAQVLSAPTLASDASRVSPEEEAGIERHYREAAGTVDEPAAGERSLATEATFDAERPLGLAGEAVEVVRSEEDLVVDTRVVGSERVRLVKRIVTEQVTRTVEVRHEELVVERERLDEVVADRGPAETVGVESGQEEGTASPPSSRRERISDRLKEALPSLPTVPLGKLTPGGGAFSGETTEITLMQEEVVLTKRIVPRERVRVRKEVVTEQREISDTLRKERVDIEHGPRGPK